MPHAVQEPPMSMLPIRKEKFMQLRLCSIRSPFRFLRNGNPAAASGLTSNGVWIMPLRRVLISAMLGIVSLVLVPVIVLAEDCPPTGKTSGGANCYFNPVSVGTFSELVTAIAKAVVSIGGPIAAAAIIFVGVRFVIAAASGNEGAVTKAKTMLWYVLIGTVIIVGGAALADAVVKFIQKPL